MIGIVNWEKKERWFFPYFSIFSNKMTLLLSVCYYHVTYEFQSESKLYSLSNVKELLARSRRNIWSLSDRNGIRTHNHSIRKRILNHLAKLVGVSKCSWLRVNLQTKWLWVRIPLLSLDFLILRVASHFVIIVMLYFKNILKFVKLSILDKLFNKFFQKGPKWVCGVESSFHTF